MFLILVRDDMAGMASVHRTSHNRKAKERGMPYPSKFRKFGYF
jgi:hypothetical protein